LGFSVKHNTSTRVWNSGYDSLGRLKSLKHFKTTPGVEHCNFQYEYNITNCRIEEDKLHYQNSTNHICQDFEYDDADRLIQSEYGWCNNTTHVWDTGLPLLNQESYGLDGVGNFLEHNGNANTVNEMNAYQSEFDGEIGFNLDYDLRGNTTTYNGYAMICDVFGRLVGASKGTLYVKYGYDAFGRRLFKWVDNGSTAQYTYYLMEGDRVLQEKKNNVVKSFVWGSGIDELIGYKIDNGTNNLSYYAHHDAIGSTVALTDTLGDVKTRYDFTPYGECTVSGINTNPGNPYLFTGRRYESDTGLYYYRARYYSAEMGRFLSRDPIGIWGDAGNYGNGYGYAGNNPCGFVDPSGLSIDDIPGMRDSGVIKLCMKDKVNGQKRLDDYYKTKAITGSVATAGGLVLTGSIAFIGSPAVGAMVANATEASAAASSAVIAAASKGRELGTQAVTKGGDLVRQAGSKCKEIGRTVAKKSTELIKEVTGKPRVCYS